MTYQDALEFIDSFANYEKTMAWEYPQALQLDRMRSLAKEFGNPQNSFESIIIAGSKGKGSTSTFLSSILRMENYRVGLYTSPHLVDIRERIKVNGLLISQARFVEIVTDLKRVLQENFWRRNTPTYFEILTIIAFCHFKEMKVHLAVLEVGLGGLFDSTNIVNAKAVGITPISLEHTDKLGKTLAKIAVQKCGVIKSREAVVSAPQNSEVEAVIQDRARDAEARLFFVGKDMKITERDFGRDYQRFDVRGKLGDYYNLEIRLLGRHQIENAAQAVGLAKSLELKTRLKISEGAVRQGLVDAAFPGRMEVISDNPTVVLDGAHNPESSRRLIEAIKRHFDYDKLITIFGVSSDKDYKGMLEYILPESAHFIATKMNNSRSLSQAAVAEEARAFGQREILTTSSCVEALQQARNLAGANDLILVTGSLYLVGEIKKGLGSSSNEEVQ